MLLRRNCDGRLMHAHARTHAHACKHTHDIYIYTYIIIYYAGDAGVCLWAVHGAMELRVFTVVAFCAAWNGGGVL